MKLQSKSFALTYQDIDPEKMKNFEVINRIADYDIFYYQRSFLLFDALNIAFFKVKTRKNLKDREVMQHLINFYEFASLSV